MADDIRLSAAALARTIPAMPYVGRFAPSPTGPLHFGSLFTALASFLDARASGGRWLVRMDDLDRPRCEDGAAEAILRSLALHGLESDAPVVYQGARNRAYQQVFDALDAGGHLYGCSCTRRKLIAQWEDDLAPHGVYPGTCRGAGLSAAHARSARLRLPEGALRYDDRFCGPQCIDLQGTVGDVVMRRGDGLFAYALAVVADDHAAGVTNVVRGADLLDTTAAQIAVYQALDWPVPCYAHVPVQLDARGRKLSKQNHAPPLDDQTPAANLRRALRALGLEQVDSDVRADDITRLLGYGIAHWPSAAKQMIRLHQN